MSAATQEVTRRDASRGVRVQVNGSHQLRFGDRVQRATSAPGAFHVGLSLIHI